MTCRRIGLTALLVITLVPTAGGAQETVDVSKLPVDLARIQRQLRQAEVREVQRNGLNLEYFVDVYGQAPRLEIFTKKDNLLNGPVPYGGPTHREVVDFLTPQEYRSPVADFGNLFRWLADKAKDRK